MISTVVFPSFWFIYLLFLLFIKTLFHEGKNTLQPGAEKLMKMTYEELQYIVKCQVFFIEIFKKNFQNSNVKICDVGYCNVLILFSK
jgi:hypothetical protein